MTDMADDAPFLLQIDRQSAESTGRLEIQYTGRSNLPQTQPTYRSANSAMADHLHC